MWKQISVFDKTFRTTLKELKIVQQKTARQLTTFSLYLQHINAQIGQGCFTREKIPKHAFVSVYEGETLSAKECLQREEEELQHLDRHPHVYRLVVHKNLILDARDLKPSWGFAPYLNHSRTSPNIALKKFCFLAPKRVYVVVLYALRDIEKGEELLFDYGFSKEPEDWAKSSTTASSSPNIEWKKDCAISSLTTTTSSSSSTSVFSSSTCGAE